MSPESPSRLIERDARERVDAVVHDHQLTYSIAQLRLVGLILLLALVVRIALFLALGFEASPLQRLQTLADLAHWLPLLPLAISLCLLGGGRRRLAAEHALLDALHLSLIPLGLACLLVLPLFCVHESVVLNSRRLALESQQQALLSSQIELMARAREARSGADVARLGVRAGIPVPIQAGESADVARWRLERAISARNLERLQKEPLLNLTPQQQTAFGLYPAVSTVLVSAISGVGLLLLLQQSRRQLRQHGLSPGQFFRSDGMGHGEPGSATRHGRGRMVSRRRR